LIGKKSIPVLIFSKATMKIIIKQENGPFLLYLGLFGYCSLYPELMGNMYRRQTFSKISQKTKNYFKTYGLEPQMKQFLDLIFTQYRNTIGEQTLGYISLLYQHPQREKSVKGFIKNEKQQVFLSYQKIKNKELKAIASFHSSLLKTHFFLDWLEKLATLDIKRKNTKIPEIKRIINNDLTFLGIKKPIIQKIIITPLNLYPFQAASLVYILDKEIIIVSSEKFYPEVIEHEFLHLLMNPLAKRFLQKFPKMANPIAGLSSLARKETYGENPLYLLQEELIYSYLNFKKRKSLNYENFLKSLPFKNEKQFQEARKNNSLFRKKCERLKINSFKNFLTKSLDYYQIFLKNQLKEILYQFYKSFKKEKTTNPDLDFSHYLLNNLSNAIKIKKG